MVNVIIRKDIIRRQFGVFPRNSSRIKYDAKAPKAKKLHCLFYQQGMQFGQVGDCCDYLTHEELLALEREGYVTIHGMRRKVR